MKKIAALNIVLAISFFAACCAHAESYNEDAYFKDYVTREDNSNTVLAVNRDTEQIELYWSDKDQAWLKPDEKYLEELKKLYRKKTQLKWMQRRLDQMREDTMYTTNEGNFSSRR